MPSTKSRKNRQMPSTFPKQNCKNQKQDHRRILTLIHTVGECCGTAVGNAVVALTRTNEPVELLSNTWSIDPKFMHACAFDSNRLHWTRVLCCIGYFLFLLLIGVFVQIRCNLRGGRCFDRGVEPGGVDVDITFLQMTTLTLQFRVSRTKKRESIEPSSNSKPVSTSLVTL